MVMEENLISQNITDLSLKNLENSNPEYLDDYYDAYYDEFAVNSLDNSEETDIYNDSEMSNTVYVYDTNDYSSVLDSINQGVYGCSVLLVLLLLFGIGKVVFNTLKEIF